MAYDKVVDSTVLNTGLTKIANAIREKGGTSASLSFPDAMATAIAAIKAGGGGLPDGITALNYGTFTLSSDTDSDYRITHGLGVKPNFYFIVTTGAFYTADGNGYTFLRFYVQKTYKKGNSNYAGYGNNVYVYSATSLTSAIYADSEATTTNITIPGSAMYKLKGGTTYAWVAGVMDGI